MSAKRRFLSCASAALYDHASLSCPRQTAANQAGRLCVFLCAGAAFSLCNRGRLCFSPIDAEGDKKRVPGSSSCLTLFLSYCDAFILPAAASDSSSALRRPVPAGAAVHGACRGTAIHPAAPACAPDSGFAVRRLSAAPGCPALQYSTVHFHKKGECVAGYVRKTLIFVGRFCGAL